MKQSYTAIFEKCRPDLIAIAYQMLGERATAQDLVQDTWEIWNKADKGVIKVHCAWLKRVISRLAIDALRSARVRRETYVGPWLPEPLVDEIHNELEDSFTLARECELALLWAMERLSIEQRSAFILVKVFDADYAEISELLGKSESACRKIVSRAAKNIAQTKLRFNANPEDTAVMLQKFAQACTSMNHDEVLSLLAPDVISMSDGGGRVRAALRPLIGASEVCRVLLSVMQKNTSDTAGELVIVNGQPAIAVAGAGDQNMLLTIALGVDGHIAWIYIMRNPDKLHFM